LPQVQWPSERCVRQLTTQRRRTFAVTYGGGEGIHHYLRGIEHLCQIRQD